jgi:hypothetical protein
VLAQVLDVVEHAGVNTVEQRLAVDDPVELRIDRERVVRRALEPRSSAGERNEAKLAALRHHVALEVGRLHALVGAPLGHRRRLRRDVEREATRLVPHGDGLDEGPGRELAVADGADARALDARAQRVGDAET